MQTDCVPKISSRPGGNTLLLFFISGCVTVINLVFYFYTKNEHFFLSFSTERLYNSSGRDLRRALFSLKQIFQVTHTYTHTYISHAITVSLLLQNTAGYCGHCALP